MCAASFCCILLAAADNICNIWKKENAETNKSLAKKIAKVIYGKYFQGGEREATVDAASLCNVELCLVHVVCLALLHQIVKLTS